MARVLRSLGMTALLWGIGAVSAQSAPFNVKDINFWSEQCRSLAAEQSNLEALEACEKALTQQSERPSPAQNQQTPDLWRTRAIVLFNLGRYRDAIAAFESVLTREPKSSVALTYQCEALSQLGSYEAAIGACDQAIQIDGDWGDRDPAAAWYAKAVALRRSAIKQEGLEAQRQQLEASLDAYERAASLNQDDLLASTERCETLFANQTRLQRSPSESEKADCIKATANSQAWMRSSALAWYQRGLIFRHLNQLPDAKAIVATSNQSRSDWERQAQAAFQQAANSYERSLSRNSKNAVMWTNQGLVLEQLRQDSNALIAYDRAVQISPTYSLAQAHRCGVLNALKRYQDALPACDSALQGDNVWLDDNSAYAWSQRSSAQLGLGQYSEALASVDRAIALQLSSAEAYHYRGIALWYLKRYAEAKQSVDQALQLNPQSAQAYFSLGRILASSKTVESHNQLAVEAYQKALSADLNFNAQVSCNQILTGTETIWRLGQNDRSFCAEILANQAATYWQLGEYSKSSAAADTATQLNAESFEAWYNLGVALVSLNSYPDAMQAFERAEQLRPETAYVLTGRGMALEGQGKIRDAIAAYDAALNLDPNYQVAKIRRDELIEAQQKKGRAKGDR